MPKQKLLELKKLGRYEIERHLGRGGMAEVYLAHDPSLNRSVAIKVIHDDLAADTGFVERFKQEARAIAALRHPNIIQVYDFDEREGLYYLVIEYIEGETLEKRLGDLRVKNERMPLADIVQLTSGLCSAANYAHQRGMVHRDIKPSNVMFNTDNQPVLMDFGVAKIVNTTALTATNALTGTPRYMSPEQAQALPLDGRSDIYSLATMLYEMVAGTVPFQAEQAVSLLLKLVYEQPAPPSSLVPDLPQPIEVVIMKGLAKSPDDRYAKATDLAEALEQAYKASLASPSPPARLPGYVSTEGGPRPEVPPPPRTTPLLTFKVFNANLNQTAAVSLPVNIAIQDLIPLIIKGQRWPDADELGKLTYNFFQSEDAAQPLAGGLTLEQIGIHAGATLVMRHSGKSLQFSGASLLPPQGATRGIATLPMLVAATGKEFLIGKSAMILGRGDTTLGVRRQLLDIDLTELDPSHSVSRQHAQILWRKDGIYVRDLNSLNGVRINGREIAAGSRQLLTHGDTLQLGDVVLKFKQA